MSSSIISLLNFISQQITLYICIPIFIAGIIGGFLNLIVFLSLKTFRQNSCAFYLIIMSLTNISQLMTGLFSRIMISGFGIDWTQTSLFYCKFRPFILNLTSLISSSCLCLATIDQYFATCTRPRWQQWCNIKIAYRLLLICSIIAFIEQIPTTIFYNHILTPTTNQTTCTITNINFAAFDRYFTVITLWLAISLTITVSFGILAYRNVQQIAYRTNPLVRRELDKQLTVMVLVQVIYNFIAIIPNAILSLLDVNENIRGNAIIFAQINLAYIISICLFYSYFSSPFYIYICVSERFRRQLIYVIFNIHLNQARQRLAIVNQIVPLT